MSIAAVIATLNQTPRPSPREADAGLTYAGQPVTHQQIWSTIRLLTYYRRFLNSPDHSECRDPEQPGYFDFTMDKPRVCHRLGFLLNVAINRKAGIPDVVGRKQGVDYQAAQWRDSRRVRDALVGRVIVRQFETRECRERFRWLLWDDEEN